VVLDERDVDREFTVALEKLLRAVEWIDEPVARPALARSSSLTSARLMMSCAT
jgi:hypothetical protein